MTRKRFSRFRPTMHILERRDLPSFTAAPSYPAGYQPGHIASGDFNGDNVLDLAVTNASDVSILTGNGDGSFSSPATFSTPYYYWYCGLTVADISGDSIPDLVGCDHILDQVHVYTANGDGTFSPLTAYPAGNIFPGGITTGDFDENGEMDVLVNENSGVSVLLNSGGSLQPPLTTPGGDNRYFKVGDLNGDGHLDFVSVGYSSAWLGLGNGDGTFKPPNKFDTDGLLSSIEVADFDNDGDLDVAVPTGWQDDDLTVFSGNGNGTFAKIIYPGLPNADEVVAADVDGDGDQDLLVSKTADAGVTLMRNQLGNFRRRVNYAINAPVNYFISGDFNSDGFGDVVASTDANAVTVLEGSGPALLKAATFTQLASSTTFATAAHFNSDSDLDFGVGPFKILTGGTGSSFKQFSSHATDVFWGSGSIAGMKAADLDGDGDTDAALTQSTNSIYKMSLWMNNGDGKFPGYTNYPLGINDTLFNVAAGDLNNDGFADAVTTAQTKVYLFFGNGAGGLTGPTTFQVGTSPTGIAAEYINGDGFLDLIVTNQITGTGFVTVLLGTGGGSFGAPITTPVFSKPTSVRAGDFDGDGDNDLAVGHYAGNNISLLLSNGDGTFAPELIPATGGTGARNLAVEDFDGDGELDVVAANYGTHNLSILLGNGNGTFKPPTTFANISWPKDIDLGDFDGDGKFDLVVTGNSNVVDFLRGNGNGTFKPQISHAAPSLGYAISTGDFNADGKLDFAVAVPSAVALYRGDGMGGFKPFITYSGGNAPQDLTVGDFNGDGVDDAVVANILQAALRILPGDPGGGFTGIQLVPDPLPLDFLDVNADGAADLLKAAGTVLQISLNEGSGTFGPPTFYGLGAVTGPTSVVIGDFNEDGKTDVMLTHGVNTGGHTVSILLGNGNGTFGPPTGISTASVDRLATGDFNGDGNLDVIASKIWTPTVFALLGNGNGTFTSVSSTIGGSNTLIVTGDFNGDGNSDLAAQDGYDLVRVALSNGNGTFAPPSVFSIGDNLVTVAIGDLDLDGWLDIAVVDNSKIMVLRNLGDWPPLPIPDGPNLDGGSADVVDWPAPSPTLNRPGRSLTAHGLAVPETKPVAHAEPSVVAVIAKPVDAPEQPVTGRYPAKPQAAPRLIPRLAEGETINDVLISSI